MKVRNGALAWVAFAICAVVILLAMSWQTMRAIRAERDRIAAEGRADLQERMRLALWRMDSLGAVTVVSLNRPQPEAADLVLVRRSFVWSAQPSEELPKVLENVPGGCLAVLAKLRTDGKSPAELENLIRENNLNRASMTQQKAASNLEWLSRGKIIDNALSRDPFAQEEESVAPRAIWIGSELFLFKVDPYSPASLRGTWLDVGLLKNRLLREVRDILPGADLVPAQGISDDGLVLASFPLRLQPGSLPGERPTFSTPIAISLAVGWLAVVLAILAATVLAAMIIRLSERRASFVSAVTHELRTPLTTFRLYSEMLANRAVKPEKQDTYLKVLSREADRLSHLVENVLAFSRIERRCIRKVKDSQPIAEVLEPMRERFEARLASANLTLRMELQSRAALRKIRLDTASLEHILFNLIDNAAKYAAGSDPAEVELRVEEGRRKIRILAIDHGPGIADSEKRRIFRAFHKSARQAAESSPGVGLGLALSRRLARAMGGDLTCGTRRVSGSCFVLTLPVH